MNRAVWGVLVPIAIVAGTITVAHAHGGQGWSEVVVGVSPRPSDEGSAAGGTSEAGGLQPGIARAFAKAQRAAAGDGVDLTITSGWRSRAKQQQLYDDAIAKYGSAAEARKWVLPPDESEHVRGRAIDVGPPAGARWLEQNGVRFGLCRPYENETWHFELLAPNPGQACPARKPYA